MQSYYRNHTSLFISNLFDFFYIKMILVKKTELVYLALVSKLITLKINTFFSTDYKKMI